MVRISNPRITIHVSNLSFRRSFKQFFVKFANQNFLLLELLIPAYTLFSRKALYEIKASGLQLRNKLHITLGYWSRDMLNFELLGKGLVLFSLHILCIIFQEKCFSCHVLLTDQISLPGCLYFLRYWSMCIAIVN